MQQVAEWKHYDIDVMDFFTNLQTNYVNVTNLN